MAYRIQQRRDTAARWAEMNPILLDGEMGLVTDNPNQYKIGDGVHTWNELPLRGYTGTISQEFGEREDAVVSQKVVSEKFSETEQKLSDIGSEVEKIEVFGEGVEKELTQYSSYQKRAYFYGNYKKGEKVKVSITGDATLVTEGVIAMRPDDEVTCFVILSMGSNTEVEITKDTTYIVFLLNNNNIVKEGAIFCKMEGVTDLKKDVKNNTDSISVNNKDITDLKNLEASSFKFRSTIEDVLNDSLAMGVYTIPPTASNLPEEYPRNVYSWLIVFHNNFRVLYSQSNELWWTIASRWVKISSQKDIEYITERINGLEKAIFGNTIGEEEVIGEELKLDQYVNKNTGRVNTYADNNLSIAPFPIQKGEVYKISVAKTTNAAGYVLCYAETIHSLECTPIVNTVGNRGKFEYTYIADKDGYLYIGISTDSEYTTVVNEKKEGSISVEIVLLKSVVQSLYEAVERLKGSGIDWRNKKWVVIGDSLSTNNRTTDKRYIDYIVEKTGIQVEVLAVGGSSYGKPQLENNAFFQQAARVASDADIVTIFGSFNGWYLRDSEGNITDGPTSLGELDSEDVSTRYGCMNMTLKNIFANAPLARVGVIYPTPWKTVNPFTPTPTGNDLMEMLDNVTKRWGVPKLDLFHGSGMRPWEEEYRLLVYSKDSGGVDGNPSGVHPNEIGHEVIATHVLEFMKTLLF